ncbi:oligopeptide ABC transporter substrate-binding protein OppA [Aliidongia dinghuensis]|uniref:Oligopeptide ABC transporter substrate-binding protein OppA n=1 Tax=Aliidongia dinghuensis TaxID=1867774 RepID=A0A8J2YRU2_9PROT|nr:peptide ABC transporter substrate-binding protein [Aliidongia dinghuensis]GGF09088.1 oligopeptide ABC transporter substrate-binding protein OppA [Aliidongia dinghuensis]
MRLAPALTVSLLLMASTAHADHVLRRANEAEPESLDPQKTTGLYEANIERDLFVGLLTLDPEMKVVPGIAERWEASTDKKVWTFHLRHDAKWSNGDPVTAADFVYSFRRLVDPKTAAAETEQVRDLVNAEELIAGREKDPTKLGIAAPDPYTVVITLKQPQIMLPLLLTDSNVVALNRKAIEGNAEWTRPGKIVTNGPFTLDSWTPNSEIVLKKNPGFYDAAKVALDGVRWIMSDNLETGFKRFRAGEIDVARAPRTQIKWARENLGTELHAGDVFGQFALLYNMKNGPFVGHPKLREALSLAVDRDLIVSKIVPEGEKPAYSTVPPVISDYTPPMYDWKDQPMAERLARAKQLLADEGYGPDHPFKFEITYTTNEQARTMLLAIAAMWKPLGVEVTLQNQEWQVFEATLRQKNYAMAPLGGTVTYDDAMQLIEPYVSTSTDQNTIGYASPAYDKFAGQASVATDIKSRAELMEQAERIILADYAEIPLYYQTVNMLVSAKVGGWRNANPYIQSRYLSRED